MLINRRTMLFSLVALASGAIIGLSNQSGPKNISNKQLAQAFWSLFKEPSSAGRIGQNFIKQFPQDSSVLGLLHKIVGDWSPLDIEQAILDESFLRKKISCQQQDDFQKNKTTSFNGWILSQTELNICALIARIS